MTLFVLKCPQCSAPLTPPSKFARSMVCPYCNATVIIDPSTVSTARFRDAYKAWNDPARYRVTNAIALGDSRWAPGELLAHGENADVYVADRARFPSERVLLKIGRDASKLSRLKHEHEVLRRLHQVPAAGSFDMRIPEPIAFGTIREGAFEGHPALVLRWLSGFKHTFEGVRAAFPHGIKPIISVWMWRRILEVLTFVHRAGVTHGAVTPDNLLVQENEHGIRLVGYGSASFDATPKSIARDLAMSARAVAYVLGGDLATGDVPSSVPRTIAAILRRAAREDSTDAWNLREEIGAAGHAEFGRSSFNPLVMPG